MPTEPDLSQMGTSSNHAHGVALMALGFFCFSASDTLTKLLTDTAHPIQIVWARQAGLMCVVLYFVARRGLPVLKTARPALQLTRGALAVLAPLCLAVGLANVPLADAIAVTFVAPLIVIGLSAIFLGENVTRRQWIATLVGLAGALIIVRPGTGVFHPSVIFIFCTAIFFATRQVLGRALVRTDDALTTMAYTGIVGFAALSLTLPLVWQPPRTAQQAMIYAGMALFAAFGEIFTIRAVAMAEAAVVAPIQYTTMLWATVFGWLIFAHLPDGWTWTGSAIIAASGIYIIRSAGSVQPSPRVTPIR